MKRLVIPFKYLFQAVNNSNVESDGKLVLVYLPTKYELDWIASPDEWIEFIEWVGRTLNIPAINIIKKFRSRGNEENVKLFTQSGESLKHPGPPAT